MKKYAFIGVMFAIGAGAVVFANYMKPESFLSIPKIQKRSIKDESVYYNRTRRYGRTHGYYRGYRRGK